MVRPLPAPAPDRALLRHVPVAMQPDAANRPVTIITGASRGIGAVIAGRRAADGHDLALTYRDREAGSRRGRACVPEASGARVPLHCVDFADLEAAATVVPAAIERFGTVTGNVNNAGHHRGDIAGFLDGTIEESDLVFRVNVLAPIVLTRPVIAHMATDRGGAGGCIVNISSGAATIGAPNTYIPYAMSKAALNALTTGTARSSVPSAYG